MKYKKQSSFFIAGLLALSSSLAQNVGIGISNPATKLSVFTGNTYGIEHTNQTVSIKTYLNSSYGQIGTITNHPFDLMAFDGTAMLRVMPSGVVGIGATNPSLAGLVVQTKVGAVNALFGQATTGVAIESDFPGVGFNTYFNAGRKFLANGFGALVGLNPANGDFYILNTAAAGTTNAAATVNTRMLINKDGNMGLQGNLNPIAPLSFASSLGNKISLYGSSITSLYGLGIQSNELQIFTPTVSDDIVFGIGGSANFSEAVRIKGNGNMGIGTDNPAEKLAVVGNGIGISQQSQDGSTKVGFYTIAGQAYVQTHTNHNLNFGVNNGTPVVTIATNGNVGVGTITPGYKFHINGDGFARAMTLTGNVSGLGTVLNLSNAGNGIGASFSGGSIGVLVSGAATGIQVNAAGDGENAVVISKGRLKFKGNLASTFAHGITYTNNSGSADRMFIGMFDDNQLGFYGFGGSGWGMLYNVNTGQINMGATRNATGYKLNVGGKIMSEEVRVQLQAAWPDYVFADNYALAPIAELESYIQTNKHLPGFKPANIMEKEGADVGEVQRKLVEKVEELTLYIIELKKEIDQIKQQRK